MRIGVIYRPPEYPDHSIRQADLRMRPQQKHTVKLLAMINNCTRELFYPRQMAVKMRLETERVQDPI